MSGITGVTQVKIGGVDRALACDMLAGDLLFDALGEHWHIQLAEWFLGRPDGAGNRVAPAMRPSERMTVLHALLARDRRDSGRSESVEDLARSLGPGDVEGVKVEMMRCVMLAFHVPGEVVDAVLAGGQVERPGSEPAETHGTGTKRSKRHTGASGSGHQSSGD